MQVIELINFLSFRLDLDSHPDSYPNSNQNPELAVGWLQIQNKNKFKSATKPGSADTYILVMSTISKRKQKRSDIEAYYQNESKTF